jgi:hypothetical protein
VEWFGTENVGAMFWKRNSDAELPDETAMEYQNSALDKRGFVPSAVLSKASEFSLKQSRSRAIGLYIKKTKTKAYLPDPDRTFLSFRCKPLALESFMGKQSEYVAAIKETKPSKGESWRQQLENAYKKLGKACATTYTTIQ